MISTDRGLLDATSRVSERFRMYAELFESLDVIVFSVGNRDAVTLAPNVNIYPTNSSTKVRYFADASRIARGLRANVVSGQDPFETGFAAYRISKILDAKLHLQVHTDVFSDAFRFASVLNQIRVRVAMWLLPKAQGVRVVSERIARSLKRNVPTLQVEPVVLPIVVTKPETITPMNFPFAQTVLMVSRLEAEKQVEQAIEGFLLAYSTRPDVGLVIVGEGSLRASLERLVASKRAEKAVQFLGSIPNVFDAYAGADIFLQTSRYEGYGMTLVEAALSGLPIVTTDVGVVGEVLVDGGSCLVTRDESVDIATKLGLLLDEEPLRQTIGGRAREAAEGHVMGEDMYLDNFQKAFTIKSHV